MRGILLRVSFWTSLVNRSVLWTLLYLVGYLQLDFRWFSLVLLLSYLVHLCWKQRSNRAASANSKNDNEGLKASSTQELPAWVLYPDTQRTNWTNVIFKHLWPHLNDFLKQTLATIEADPQLIDRLKGYNISAVRFPQVNLGEIPPKLNGVQVHKAVHRDEIVLDFAVQYNGDLRIHMEVEFAGVSSVLPPAAASISNMSMSGNLRVHLRPLLKDVPFIGGITVSFLQSPAIDFDLGGLANFLDLPGINLLLRHVIQDQLEQTIVMPNSITMKVGTTEYNNNNCLSSRTDGLNKSEGKVKVALPAGVLSVHLIESKDLVNRDVAILGQGKSDPYAKLRIAADGTVHNFKTDVVPDNLHPVWKLLIDIPVDDPDSLDDLQVEIWDHDIGSKDDFLGKCSIGVQTIHTAMTTGQLQDVWKVLDRVRKGSFHAEVGWAELKLSRPDPKVSGDLHCGVISVYVDSCVNLLGGRTGLKLPNPLVRVELCNIVQYTDHVIGSVNPVFGHRMNFLVRDPLSDTLKISVIDQKRNQTPLGSLRFNLSDLVHRSTLSMNNHTFVLQTRGATGQGGLLPSIILSFGFRYIHRPKTSSFGVHKSLQDLHKIMSATINKPKESSKQQAERKEPEADQDSRQEMPKLNTQVEEPAEIPVINRPKSDPDESIVVIPSANGLVDTSELLRETPTASSPPSLPDIIKVRPEEATEFVRNHTVRKSVPLSRTSRWRESAASGGSSVIGTLPTSATVPVVKDLTCVPKVQLSLKYNKNTHTLSLVVHRARNLQETTHTALPCPYVKTYLLESTGLYRSVRVPNTKRKTKVQKHTVNPIFEETLEYLIRPNDLRSKRVELSICSERSFFGRNITLGRCLISLSRIHKAILAGGHDAATQNTTLTDWHELSPPLEQDLQGSSYVSRSPSNCSTLAPGSALLARKSARLSTSRSSLT